MKDEAVDFFLGMVLSLAVSAVLWFLIYTVLRWIYTWPLEVVVKLAAGAFLLVGSWLVIRACMELDRG